MIRVGLAILVGLAALGCEDPFRPAPRAAIVRITPDSLTIVLGHTVQLSAAVEDSAGRAVQRAVTACRRGRAFGSSCVRDGLDPVPRAVALRGCQ